MKKKKPPKKTDNDFRSEVSKLAKIMLLIPGVIKGQENKNNEK